MTAPGLSGWRRQLPRGNRSTIERLEMHVPVAKVGRHFLKVLASDRDRQRWALPGRRMEAKQ